MTWFSGVERKEYQSLPTKGGGGGEGVYRKLAADEGEGGKGIKRMAQPQMGSVKFYCDTIRILQPTPPPPSPADVKKWPAP